MTIYEVFKLLRLFGIRINRKAKYNFSVYAKPLLITDQQTGIKRIEKWRITISFDYDTK